MQCFENRAQAHAMRAMRITQVTRGVDLMRSNRAEQIGGEANVLRAKRLLAHASCFIERQVEKVQSFFEHAGVDTCSLCFSAPNQAFQFLHFNRVHFARTLRAQQPRNLVFHLCNACPVEAKGRCEVRGKVEKAQGFCIEDRDVAGRLIRNMHLVALIDKSKERAAHRDHIVIRVRRKDQHALRKNVVAGSIDVA